MQGAFDLGQALLNFEIGIGSLLHQVVNGEVETLLGLVLQGLEAATHPDTILGQPRWVHGHHVPA